MKKVVKIVATGYYSIDTNISSKAYGTNDFDEMLRIDQKIADENPFEAFNWTEKDPVIELSWKD